MNIFNDEHAHVFEWEPQWSAGAPCPIVMAVTGKTLLMYYCRDQNIALVEFTCPFAHRFGEVNRDVAHGHPLYKRGLKTHEAHIVENSTWIEELKSIHKVHPQFNEAYWVNRTHYILFFHDEMFEIIAEGYDIETIESTYEEVIEMASQRLSESGI